MPISRFSFATIGFALSLVTGPASAQKAELNRAAELLNRAIALKDQGQTDASRLAANRGRELLPAMRQEFPREVRLFEASAVWLIGETYDRDGDLRSATAYYDTAAARWSELKTDKPGELERVHVASFPWRLHERWMLTTLGRAMETGARKSAVTALAISDEVRAPVLRDLRRSWVFGARTEWVHSFSPGRDYQRFGEKLVGQLDSVGISLLYYEVTYDTLLTWLVSSGGTVQTWRTGIRRDSLARLAADLRVALGARPFLESGTGDPSSISQVEWQVAARRLAQLLLPSTLIDDVPTGELLVAPDGPLALIPFAVLPLPNGQMLAQRYAARYTPSPTALFEIRPAHRFSVSDLRGVGGTRALVVGNPIMPRVATPYGTIVPSRLPHAESEARAVGQAVGASPLVGPEATEARVVRALGDAALIHIATHGFVHAEAQRAHESFIALGEAEGDDGLFTIGELIAKAPPLRAELVVLSACETGVGNLQETEGTLGLQRAFLGRGASSVLVSLWNVQSPATTELMMAFYDEWMTRGASKAEALRRAQLRVRETPGREHPRFWAAFQLVGAQ